MDNPSIGLLFGQISKTGVQELLFFRGLGDSR